MHERFTRVREFNDTSQRHFVHVSTARKSTVRGEFSVYDGEDLVERMVMLLSGIRK